MRVAAFEGREPRLRLETFFAGDVRAWGIFEDRLGRLRREFAVDMTGHWNGSALLLDERFRYADGEVGRRLWRIEPDGPHGYVGRADDIVGEARGAAHGNALNWRYAMDLRIGRRQVRVRFEDWMYLQEPGFLVNRARASKWGLTIGTATIFFARKERLADDAAPAVSGAAGA